MEEKKKPLMNNVLLYHFKIIYMWVWSRWRVWKYNSRRSLWLSSNIERLLSNVEKLMYDKYTIFTRFSNNLKII